MVKIANSPSVLEGMIDAAQTETGLEIGKVEKQCRSAGYDLWSDDSQVDILIAELSRRWQSTLRRDSEIWSYHCW